MVQISVHFGQPLVNAFDGAPFHLTPFMSCRYFEKILFNQSYCLAQKERIVCGGSYQETHVLA